MTSEQSQAILKLIDIHFPSGAYMKSFRDHLFSEIRLIVDMHQAHTHNADSAELAQVKSALDSVTKELESARNNHALAADKAASEIKHLRANAENHCAQLNRMGEKISALESMLSAAQQLNPPNPSNNEVKPDPRVPNRLCESITQFEYDNRFFIRVWRSEEVLRQLGPQESQIFLWALGPSCDLPYAWDDAAKRIANTIGGVAGVTAVEVKNIEGNGMILYPDWS